MKKALIIAAVAAAGAAGAYFINQHNASTAYNVLDYVPADTPIFTGQLEPFPLKDYLASAPVTSTPNSDEMFAELYTDSTAKVNFFLNIFKTYQDSLKDADLLIKTFGFPEELRAYFYTLGLMPVLKIEVENPQAVWDLLDKSELESGFTHTKGTLQTVNYRAYQLSDDTDEQKVELIIAQDKGLLTLTLNTSYNDQTLLSTALGLTPVENSLANSGVIEQTIKKYNFDQSSLAFINHIEIIKGLTTSDGNQLARQLTSLAAYFDEERPLADIQTPECAADFAGIAENWPRTVFGYTHLDINKNESTMEMATIVESKNQAVLNALKTIRGYIPEYTADIENNVFAMGLGIDVSLLAGSLTDIWSDLQTPSYTCAPLAELQAEISQSGESIGMLSMGANVANGVKGIGAAVLDYTISQINDQPMIENLDALFTISSDNPELLFNSVKMFSPEFQHIQLSSTSQPVELGGIFPIPAQLNIAPKLAIKGNHLVIYNGEKGKKAAENLSTEKLSQNGIYNFSFDFKKTFAPIVTAAELSGEPMPEEAMFLIDYDARMKMGFDINDQGLVFDSYMNNKAPE
ncbi:hypothetical protein [Psychromonas aquimarina]|uniref:hypothetical protein n=1 Tax=Psychromonas aquimarina TaxID=444919 RepID=UPI00042375C8|nr:hypothetical protein [Psychromonas aquimarina]